jgi:hypothetical protein
MLSQKAKYALKALLALAQAPKGELLQGGKMAVQENIPKKFLNLILLELRKHRLIDSVRGKHGGYILLRPPAKLQSATLFGSLMVRWRRSHVRALGLSPLQGLQERKRLHGAIHDAQRPRRGIGYS